MASPPRRARRRGGISLAHHRPSRWDRRLRRSAPGPARAFDGARRPRRAPGGDRRDRPRRRRRAVGRVTNPVPGVGPVPPAGRVRTERRADRGRRALPRVARRPVAARRRDRGAGRDRRLRARGRLAAVRRARGDRGLARLVGVARGEAAGSLVLPPRRCGDPSCLEPVLAARCRVPALVRRRRRDLRRRPAARAQPRRLPGAPLAGGGGRRLRRLWGRDRADPPHAVRRRSALFDPRQRARGARRRARCSGSLSSRP